MALFPISDHFPNLVRCRTAVTAATADKSARVQRGLDRLIIDIDVVAGDGLEKTFTCVRFDVEARNAAVGREVLREPFCETTTATSDVEDGARMMHFEKVFELGHGKTRVRGSEFISGRIDRHSRSEMDPAVDGQLKDRKAKADVKGNDGGSAVEEEVEARDEGGDINVLCVFAEQAVEPTDDQDVLDRR